MSGEPVGKAGAPAGGSGSGVDWRKWAAILSALVAVTALLKWVYGVSSWQEACAKWLRCSGPLPSGTTIFPESFSVGNGASSSIEYAAVVRPASWQTSGVDTCIHVSCSAGITAIYQNLAGTTGDARAHVVRYKDASTATSVANWLTSFYPAGDVNDPAFVTKGNYLVEVGSCCWNMDWSKGIFADEWIVNLSLTNLIFASLPSS